MSDEKEQWSAPEAEEIRMDAEIGSYQADGDDPPPFARDAD